MELHTPFGQEAHPLRQSMCNTFWINEIQTADGAEFARAGVIIRDVALRGFSCDLQVTLRQRNLPYFRLRSASAD